MKEVRSVFRLLESTGHIAVWVIGTMWLGGTALWRAGVLVSRWRAVFAETRLCARGHATAMYGVFECRCGALVEDWAFARCRVCGQSAGWTPCSTCQLPIKSPLVI